MKQVEERVVFFLLFFLQPICLSVRTLQLSDVTRAGPAQMNSHRGVVYNPLQELKAASTCSHTASRMRRLMLMNMQRCVNEHSVRKKDHFPPLFISIAGAIRAPQ